MAVSEKQQETKLQYKVTPRHTAWSEEGKIIIRVVLPGVDKKDIEMKALRDKFLLRGKRDDILYKLDLDLNFNIDPEKTETSYKEGLLRVELKVHNPMDDAFDVKIE